MGSGASNGRSKNTAQQNPRQQEQPLPTQTRTNAVEARPVATTTRTEMTTTNTVSTELETARNDRVLTHNVQRKPPSPIIVPPRKPAQISNRSPSVDSMEPPALAKQQDSSDDSSDEEAELPNRKASSTSSSSTPSSTPTATPTRVRKMTEPPTVTFSPVETSVRQPATTSSRKSSSPKNLLSEVIDSRGKSPIPSRQRASSKLPEQSDRCAHCPHCQLPSPTVLPKIHVEQPPWVLKEPPSNDYYHINMDHYDEEAVRNRLISDRGRLPGSYDYSTHLAIDERKEQASLSGRYLTLPAILKRGTTNSPTHTPFPDYEILQRRQAHFNRPYALPLFSD